MSLLKFLFSDADGIKKIGDMALEVIGQAPATEAMFTTHGADDLSKLKGTFTNVTLPMVDGGALGAGKQFSLTLPNVIEKLTSIKVKA